MSSEALSSSAQVVATSSAGLDAAHAVSVAASTVADSVVQVAQVAQAAQKANLPSLALVLLVVLLLVLALTLIPRWIGNLVVKEMEKQAQNGKAADVAASRPASPGVQTLVAPTASVASTVVTAENEPTEVELVAILAAAAADALGVCASRVVIAQVHEDHSWRMQGRSAHHHSHKIR
jgi:hypothetical protein